MHLITVRGILSDGNCLTCDDGRILRAFPYGIDAGHVFHKPGYFLLKKAFEAEDEYIVVNFLQDSSNQTD